MLTGFRRMIDLLTRSIPRRILVALLSIYLATYLATALVVYSGVRASILEAETASLKQLADLKFGQLVNIVDATATNLTAWSKLDVMNDLVSGDIDKRVAWTLEELKRLYGLTGDIYAFDAEGKLLASSATRDGTTMPVRLPEIWQTPGEGLVLVKKTADPAGGGDIMTFETPVFGRFDSDYRIGTLVLTYPWRSIEKSLFDLDNGIVLLDRTAGARVLAANPDHVAEDFGADRIDAAIEGVQGDYVVGRSVRRDSLIGGWEVVALKRSDIATQSLRRVALELLLLGVCLSVPIILLGRWLSNRLTAPIADLTGVVSKIASTDRFDARAPIPAPEELGTLARSFNQLVDNLQRTTGERENLLRDLTALNQNLENKIAERTAELESAMEAQKRLIGDISHEIKSPLARLSMALGLAQRADPDQLARHFERIEREIERISALASELLVLARLEGSAPPPAFQRVDLAPMMGQIVEDAGFETPERANDLRLSAAGDAFAVAGDADLLRRAMENIVRNAVFYTSPGTPVDIRLSAAEDRVLLSVADQGPGVPSEALPHLFEPFYRVDEARARATGGTGIGLAICQRVVSLHGGRVTARSGDPHGLIIEIELPAAGAGQDGRQS